MDLPYEVLVYLFKYLPKADRKAASETCHSWYMAAKDQCFLRNTFAVIFRSVLDDEATTPLKVFENSPIIYYNYLFNEVEITSKQNDFFNKLGEHIRHLTLINCDICEKVFVYMLKKCTNLEVLNVQECKVLFMSGRLLEGKTEGFLTENLENLKALSLSGNRYLTDALFQRFVSAAPNLEELNLSDCSLQFHEGLVGRFYRQKCVNIPSESVLTFFFILQWIKARAKNIKRLNFSYTLFDGTALEDLSKVDYLKLEELRVRSCDQLNNICFWPLTQHQSSLRVLDLSLCQRVSDSALENICNHLLNLEYLNIQRCREVSDMAVAGLKNLPKLKSVNISQCESLTKEALLKGICTEINETIEELDISSICIDQIGLMMVSDRLPKLRKLNVSHCFNAVTDISIQVIFKNQLLLEVLKMSHCNSVTDAGLSGMCKQVEVHNDDDNIPLTANYNETPVSPKIHLGSRAEEEIVRDARRKQEVLLMCEKPMILDTYSGYSLDCLKKIQELDLSGCNRITDVSLTYAFDFKELVTLNLSRCQQITHNGIAHLVRKCPSIEYVNLVDCYNLKDEAVTDIVIHLKRLKQLQLRGCNQLTNTTLEAVITHCKSLKYLDVQGCNMTSEHTSSITSMPLMHTFLSTSSEPYIIDGVKNRKPAPAFLPALMRKLRLH